MAVKGSIVKETIKNEILAHFDGAFIAADGKTIRVPMQENGELVEVKITLTAAKDVESVSNAVDNEEVSETVANEPVTDKPSEQELANVAALIEKLGL